ncbi:MAG: DUF4886 domain-containing protein [Gammaproteobacteria bacterium]
MKKYFFILFISFVLAADNDGNLSNKNILFVGNSYLYYNDSLHNHVKRMAIERFPSYEEKFIYKSSTIGGARSWHHNFKHLLEPTNIGVNEPFDLLILQGGSAEPLSKNSRIIFKNTVKEVNEIAKEYGTKLALYMTHAYVAPDIRYEANMINKISSMYTNAGKENNVKVIPVGIGFENAYKENPNIQLHNLDGTHPSLLGTYLAACIVYGVLYDDSPVGIDYNYFGKVSDQDRIFIQKIAYETITNFQH